MSAAVGNAPAVVGRGNAAGGGAWLLALPVIAFILLFLVFPVASVLYTALADGQGGFTLGHIAAFLSISLMREAFVNSVIVATGAVLLSTAIAVPLAYLTVRFQFRGAALVQTLGVLPLVMPPFVGAVALQLLFGRNGSFNLLLNDLFGFRIPFMEGLTGVIFVEGLHYFPFILLNLSAALANIDGAMEEAAQNLGSQGFRLFRRVVFPLAAPGFVAGAALVFVKVFDDLGTPLVLHVTNMLAPQAYLRITSVGLEDPIGYVIALVMIVFSIAALALSARITKGRDYATLSRGGSALRKRPLTGGQAALAYGWVLVVLALVLSPHVGLLLLSLAKVWSFSVLPDGYTLNHFAVVLTDSSRMIGNTLLYCTLAAGIDVVLGAAIAYLLLRTCLPGRQWLDWGASAALAIPGVVLAIGFLRAFRGIDIPIVGGALTASWIAIMLAYAVRRLPYAVRSCVAALQQVHVSLEEAAQSLGADRRRTVRRIVIPLMAGGILAGFVTSFITAAVELSATILLATKESQAPLSYGIYLYNQSIATRGPAAALGVIAIVIVGVGTWLSHRLLARRAGGMKMTVDTE
jgi:iron(III) transport system permease protein